MANIIRPRAWSGRSLNPLEEKQYQNRRKFLRTLGLGSLGLAAAPRLIGQSLHQDEPSDAPAFHFSGEENFYPAPHNQRYEVIRPLSAESAVTQRNNFTEFISPGDTNIYNAHKYVGNFDTSDWQIEIAGRAERTGTFNLGDLITEMGTEERLYRFRCVERWSMVVPWTGFSLAKLIDYCQPKSNVQFVRFVAKADKAQMPGVSHHHWYQWPFTEGLSMEEARNELTFMATGLYGKPLPKQNGAPLRLVVPWQYGYKSIKSIARIEFTREQPPTFWGTISPKEYPFHSVVDPKVPHPRWPQLHEWDIATGEQLPTLPFNGYGKYVAQLYR